MCMCVYMYVCVYIYIYIYTYICLHIVLQFAYHYIIRSYFVRCMVHGAWCMVLGAWCMVHGAWCMVHTAWCMVHGTRYVVYHIRCIAYRILFIILYVTIVYDTLYFACCIPYVANNATYIVCYRYIVDVPEKRKMTKKVPEQMGGGQVTFSARIIRAPQSDPMKDPSHCAGQSKLEPERLE